jgi:reactive intermediate/imine deaminase
MEKIHSEKAPAAIGPYSQAIKSGNMVFISGQLGFIPGTSDLADSLEEQCRLAMENLKAIAEEAGGSLSKIVKTTIYLSDMSFFPVVNEIYSGYLNEPYPARATVAVKTLPKNGMVEIDGVLVL